MQTMTFFPANGVGTELHRHLFGGGSARNSTTATCDASQSPEPCFQAVLERVSKLVKENKTDAAIRKALATTLGAARLATLQFIRSGTHELQGGISIVTGNATIEANGDGIIIALENANITARGATQVFAADDSVLTLYDNVKAFISDNVTVKGSYGRVRGTARGTAKGSAHGQSEWLVMDNATFDGDDGTKLFADHDSRLRCFGDCTVRARGRAQVSLFGKAVGWFEEQSQGEAAGSSRAYYKQEAHVTAAGTEVRVIAVSDDKPFNCRNWPITSPKRTRQA